MKKIGVTVYIKEDLHQQFKAACKHNDLTMAAYLLKEAKKLIKSTERELK